MAKRKLYQTIDDVPYSAFQPIKNAMRRNDRTEASQLLDELLLQIKDLPQFEGFHLAMQLQRDADAPSDGNCRQTYLRLSKMQDRVTVNTPRGVFEVASVVYMQQDDHILINCQEITQPCPSSVANLPSASPP
jgi:hypothetical protein